jgi:peptidoglycan/LPS O-acetylase OafA/YrhL
MKQAAIVTCWLVIAMNLYGTYQLAQSGAAGFSTIAPMILFGMTLAIHHGKYARPLVVWTALGLIFLWGAFGLVAVVYLVMADPPKLGMALFFFVLALAPSILNVIELHKRRSGASVAHAG